MAVRRKLAELGLVGTIALVIRTLYDRVVHRDERLFCADLERGEFGATRAPAEFDFHEIVSAGELKADQIVALSGYGGDGYVEQARWRLSRGWRLWLASAGGSVAAGAWTIDRRAGYAAKAIPLLDQDVAILDCFTLPAFRGRGIYPQLLSWVCVRLRMTGVRRAWIAANERNRASIRGIEKAGFLEVIRYETYPIGSHEIVIWKNAMRATPLDGPGPRPPERR